MTTPQRCLARAEEAERLAAVVSYERDRVRLTGQAAEWRARAAELERAAEASTGPQPEPSPRRPSPLAALGAALRDVVRRRGR